MPRQKRSVNIIPAPSSKMDFTAENHGTVFLIHANTTVAREHLRENVEPEAKWLGNALAVDPQFIGGLVSSLRDNGWTV
jgi:hypothetical protein